MNKHQMEVDHKLFELMYELVDIDDIQEQGYKNMIDISVEGNQTFLLSNGILSHNSASASLSKLLGRQNQGFFAMFGVPPNAYDSDTNTLAKSDKIKDIKDVTGLKFTQKYQDELNFKEIIIATDFDLPGHFICGQLVGLFYKYGKNIIEECRLKRLVTPLLIAKDSKENIIKWFYNFDDYVEFQRNNKDKKYIYDYKKGLGSYDREELDIIIKRDGLENMLETFELDDLSEEVIDSWLSSSKADMRKEMLEGYEFNIMNQ